MTAAQLKKIWAVSHELGWDGDRLHRYVGICYGVESLKLLSREKARRLIDDMERYVRKQGTRATQGTKGGYREHGAGVDQEGKLIYYATPAQCACLRAEAGRLAWGDAWILRVASRRFERPIWKLGRIRGVEAATLINVVRGLVESRMAMQGKKQSAEGKVRDGGEGLDGADASDVSDE